MPVIIKILEKIRIKYLKNKFNFNYYIDSNKFLVTLGACSIEFVLFPRLINILRKYGDHFKKKVSLYDELISSYLGIVEDIDNLSIEEIKSLCHIKGIINVCNRLNIPLNIYYIKLINSYHMFPDKRDSMLIKFIKI